MSRKIEQTVAEILLRTGAVKIDMETPFTYVSGVRSPIYCDNRVVVGDVLGRTTIVEAFLKLIPEEVDVIVGVATAGIPWGAMIADRLGKPFAYVRPKPKAHGAGRQIEGADIVGKRLAVLEDLISTGQSSLKAAQVLLAAGAASADIYAIFSYDFASGKKNFAEAGVGLETLSNFGALVQVLGDSGKLLEQEVAVALLWNEDPEGWFEKHFSLG